MKSLILSIGLLLGFGTYLHADIKDNGRSPTVHQTQAIYTSTRTQIVSAETLISSSSVKLHTVNVTITGTNSFIELYSTKFSTSVRPQETLIDKIDTTVLGSYNYDIHGSSGLHIYNYGSPPAGVSVTFYELGK